MEQNMTFSQNIDALFSNLVDFTRNESLLGTPVTHQDKTLVPVVSITLGYGSGNSATKAQGNTAISGAANNGMGALGLGAKITTEAVVVIDKNNVSMLPVGEKSNMGQMMDKLPQMLSSLNIGGQQQGQTQGQGQNQMQKQNQGQQQ